MPNNPNIPETGRIQNIPHGDDRKPATSDGATPDARRIDPDRRNQDVRKDAGERVHNKENPVDTDFRGAGDEDHDNALKAEDLAPQSE